MRMKATCREPTWCLQRRSDRKQHSAAALRSSAQQRRGRRRRRRRRRRQCHRYCNALVQDAHDALAAAADDRADALDVARVGVVALQEPAVPPEHLGGWVATDAAPTSRARCMRLHGRAARRRGLAGSSEYGPSSSGPLLLCGLTVP